MGTKSGGIGKEATRPDCLSGPARDIDTARDFPGRLRSVIGNRSVRRFGREAGVSETVLRKYLSGKSEPGRRALVAMARAGGVSVEWLVTGRKCPQPHMDRIAEPDAAYEPRSLDAARDEVLSAAQEIGYDPSMAWGSLLMDLLRTHDISSEAVRRVLEQLRVSEGGGER